MSVRIARNVPMILASSTLLVLLIAGTLGWLGWRLLDQEADLFRQQSQASIEQSADVVLSEFLRRMAEAESWLGQMGSTLPANIDSHSDGILVKFSRAGVETRPGTALPYLPVPPASPAFDLETFRASELLEFQGRDLSSAASLLAPLAQSKDRLIRAEALLRLARVQSKDGKPIAALETYSKLRDETLISPAQVSYALLSRYARCQLLANTHQEAAAQQEALVLLKDLKSGRFAIGKQSYVWYGSRTREFAGLNDSASSETSLAVAELVESIWDEWQVFQQSGSRLLSKRLHVSGAIPLLAMLNANPDRLVALIYPGESIRSLALDASSARNHSIAATLTDEKGKVIFGDPDHTAVVAATRILSAGELPWQLRVSASAGDSTTDVLARRRNYLVFALVVIVLVVCAACYAMARGVLREASATQLQSDFVSAVSHEFRSPLTTLRQLTELLAHGRIHDESRRRQYFDVLQKETARLHQLVEDLLDFGRMDAGRGQYRLEPLDFSELVRDGIQEYQIESNSNNHRIEFDVAKAPIVVNADREGIRRVLRNLLENAVKYSPGCPTVWVETEREGRAAILRVRDSGIGIPPEERSRIFEKFVRGEGAKQACIQGTGIGLAMVKEIVRIHHGEVDLVSEVGKGSTFQVRLPLARDLVREA